MTIEIVDFPSYKMVDLSIAMLVYQRVYIYNYIDIPNLRILDVEKLNRQIASHILN